MANFLPLKRYMFYCLDKCIKQYNLEGPFLDVGCGIGDVSLHLAEKGWSGTAIDYSDIAVARAKETLQLFPEVHVEKAVLEEYTGSFNTIILWDVLEHIEDDEKALRALESLLSPTGKLLIAVPSNPREWRWDDEFYGHFRRYTTESMTEKMSRSNLKPIVFWDFTYPLFWILRRMYTAVKSAPKADVNDKESRTKESATVNAWDIPVVSYVLDKSTWIWQLLYFFQFTLFRNSVGRGHEFFVLAQKK